jgi:hypothetical protein
MRGILRFLIAGTAIAAIAGCSDSATSPSDATSRTFVPGDRPSLDYSGSGLRTMTFTLTAAGGVFRFGDLYTLTVPENAVCVPNSTYGPGTWDAPCTTLHGNQPVKVTVVYGFANGGPVVDFTPDIRFSPKSNVTLSTTLYQQMLMSAQSYYMANPSALRLNIYYTSDLGATGISEAVSDPSLTTHINLNTGLVWRRIKHFSGYLIATGLACDPSPDNPDCIDLPPIIEFY